MSLPDEQRSSDPKEQTQRPQEWGRGWWGLLRASRWAPLLKDALPPGSPPFGESPGPQSVAPSPQAQGPAFPWEYQPWGLQLRPLLQTAWLSRPPPPPPPWGDTAGLTLTQEDALVLPPADGAPPGPSFPKRWGRALQGDSQVRSWTSCESLASPLPPDSRHPGGSAAGVQISQPHPGGRRREVARGRIPPSAPRSWSSSHLCLSSPLFVAPPPQKQPWLATAAQRTGANTQAPGVCVGGEKHQGRLLFLNLLICTGKEVRSYSYGSLY